MKKQIPCIGTDRRAQQYPGDNPTHTNDPTTLAAPPAFTNLAKQWSSLAPHIATPMETFDWAVSCSAAFRDLGDARVITVTDGAKLLAVAPMIRIGRGLNARLEQVGMSRLYEPTDLVATDQSSLTRLADALLKNGTPFSLRRLPASSPAVETIKKACKGRGLVFERNQATYPYIPLDDKWNEPEQNISKGRRSDIRRASRHAEKLGPVSIQMFCPTHSEVDEAVKRAMSVEAKSWKGEKGCDMASDKPVGDFFREYTHRAARSGSLRLSFMNIGEHVAAMQIGIVHANRFWVLKVGYDPEFQKASPGILLMIEAIKYAVAQGLETYELLGTAADWTRVWTEHERESVSLRVYPANIRGGIALATDVIAKFGRKLTPARTSS